MKLTIQKIAEGTIDTTKERQRIEKCFKNRPEIAQHLNELMDAIEAEEWRKAYEMLSSKWWQEYDKKDECSRLEYIGLLFPNPINAPVLFDCHASYIDLVEAFFSLPKNYKVINKDKKD